MPTVTLVNLRGVALSADDEGWAVGDGGVILRLRAGQWFTAPSPTTNTLFGISLVDREFGFAVGEGGTLLAFQFNPLTSSQRWRDDRAALPPALQTISLTAVTAVSRTFGLIGSVTGLVYQITGTTSVVGTPPLTSAVYLTSVQPLGPGGLPLPLPVVALAAVSPTLAWAATAAPTAPLSPSLVFRWDGTSWSPVLTSTTPFRALTFREGRLLATGDTGVISQSFDFGDSWTTFPVAPITPLYGVSLGTKSYGAAVGQGGVAVRIAPTPPSAVATPVTATLRSDAAVSPARVWAVGDGGATVRYVDLTVTPSTPTPTPTPVWQPPATITSGPNLRAVAAVSRTLVFAVGEQGVILQSLDGRNWTSVTSPTTQTWRSLAATPGGAVWAVGDGNTIGGYLGGSWSLAGSPLTASVPLSAVALADPNAGLAIAALSNQPQCCLVRTQSGWSYTPLGPASARWQAVALQSPTAGWVVGADGGTSAIGLVSGSPLTFTSYPVPAVGALSAVAAHPTGVAYAGSETGQLLKYDPTVFPGWVTVPSPATSTIRSLVLLSPTEGWGLAEGNVVLRLQGGSWQVANTLFPLAGLPPLRGLAALASGDLWAVGNGGTVVWRASSPALPLAGGW
ncbi:MAG: hypothetical protein K6U89_19380 [Chloroflexi bacterium]|nr:hypothetical protein [Chloroflexota bacterium]